jgi:hypothetical protein
MLGHKKDPQSENGSLGTQAQTFTLRIWTTNQENGSLEWRGRIQHVQSGEVRYCRDWDSFTAYVEEVLWNPSDI